MDKPYPDRVRILLVEDDEDDYKLVCEALGASGSTLRWVPDYDEALSVLLTGQFDVCLLDYRLGARSGIEFLEEATRSGCPTPIIFLTGTGNYETDFAAMKGGAADYLGKGEMSAALLERTIRYAVERAEAKKRLQEEYDKLETLVQERAEELLRANRALGESQRNYRVLAESVPGMVFQFVLHSDGSFSLPYVNNRIEEYWGISPESAMADASSIFTPIHPDDRKMMREAIFDSAKTLQDFSLEHRIIDASGQTRWFRVESKPERLPNGDVCWNGLSIDITESKRAEDALRHRTEELQLILDTVPATLWLKDRDNNLLRVNRAACELMGLPATSLEGKNAGEIFPDWMAEKFYQNDLEVISSKRPTIGIEHQICNAAGELRWVSTDKSPWFDAQGNLAGVLTFAVDVTDRKRAEQEREKLQRQLFQSQKMESVGRLAGGVAHDYNNMLGVIIGYTEMALENISPDDPLHTDLQEIYKAAKRSADITRQLLAFARKQTISPVVLDLNETVEGMLKMLRRLIGEDIDLAWHPKAGLSPVKMDPSQIDQILANLFVNARDAIAGVGKITIETDMVAFDKAYCAAHEGFIPGEFVLLAVSDDGCGMEKETLKSIFEPFFTTKEVDKGTGLGLAMVYGIVKQNTGFINVYSEPGHGTTFKIYLPCAQVQVSQENAPQEKKRELRGTETILLVEDEESVLGLGRTILEHHGYTVLAACNPADALDLVKSQTTPIQLLITDVVMPAMSGRELNERLRAHNQDLKCIFMSGYTANVIAHNGVLDEGVNFLQKPFSVRALAEKVRDVLDD